MSGVVQTGNGSPHPQHYVISIFLIYRSCTRTWMSRKRPKSTHRVAMTDFWRTFHKKTALTGEGCTPTFFHSIYHHVQSICGRSSSQGRYTPPISSLPCMYSVGKTPLRYRTASPCDQGGRKVESFFSINSICSSKRCFDCCTQVRPQHYIRSILPEGPVGLTGAFRCADQLLEVIAKKTVITLLTEPRKNNIFL